MYCVDMQGGGGISKGGFLEKKCLPLATMHMRMLFTLGCVSIMGKYSMLCHCIYLGSHTFSLLHCRLGIHLMGI